MMESEPCDKLMNVQLKKHLLQQYQKSLEHYHITIISVCFSTKILNQYLPEGSLNRRFKVCDILRHATDIWKGCIRLSELKKIADESKK